MISARATAESRVRMRVSFLRRGATRYSPAAMLRAPHRYAGYRNLVCGIARPQRVARVRLMSDSGGFWQVMRWRRSAQVVMSWIFESKPPGAGDVQRAGRDRHCDRIK